MFRISILLIITLLTAGCQTQIALQKRGGYIPVGNTATLQLHKKLIVDPERARVFIQNGKVVKSRDEYDNVCAFEILTLSDKPQAISPGTFTVRKTQWGETEVVEAYPVRVASLGKLQLAHADYSPSMISLYYDFYLLSDQPDLYRMTCYGAFDMPANAVAPSVQEINFTLKGIAELKI